MGHDAFISYSHSADERIAPALEQGLERLAKPWYKLRALSVFRDQSDLVLNPHLWESIQRALDGARWFVLLASPEAAASPWVNREVEHWCTTKGPEQLLIVLTSGELAWDESTTDFTATSTAVPDALRHRFQAEPFYLDLRWAQDTPDLSLRLSAFRGAVAQLAAPIRDTVPADLESEDVRLHRRARRLAQSAVAALAVLTVVALLAAVAAVINAREADRKRREALARQLGLEALDIPVDEIDRALLLSIASSELDSSGSAADSSSRALVGRYPFLDQLVQLPDSAATAIVRGVALNDAGTELGASVQLIAPGGGSGEVLRWTAGGEAPAVSALPPSTGLAFVARSPSLAHGTTGESLTLVDATGAAEPVPGTVLAAQPALARALVAREASVAVVELDTGDTVAEAVTSAAATTGLVTPARSVAASGRELVVIPSDGGAARRLPTAGDPLAVAASADGMQLAAVVGTGGDLALQVWRGDGLQPQPPIPLDVQAVAQAFLSPDGGRALLVGPGGTTLVDAATGDTMATAATGTGRAEGDPGGRFVAVGGSRFDLWDLTTGQRITAVPDPVNDMAWSANCATDATRCALATVGRSLDVWNPVIGRRTRLAEETPAQAVAISGDGNVVASAGFAAHVVLWRLEADATGNEEEVLAPGGELTGVLALAGVTARSTGSTVEVRHGADATTLPIAGADELALLAGGGRLLARTAAGLELWDVGTGEPLGDQPPCDGDRLAVSRDGSRFVTYRTSDSVLAECLGTDGSLVAQGRLDPPGALEALAVADDGSVALAREGHVQWVPLGDSRFGDALDVDTGFGTTTSSVQSLAIAGRRVAAGLSTGASQDPLGQALIWEVGGPPVVFDLAATDVGAVTLSGPDGEFLATASRDQADGEDAPWRIQAWESSTRRRLGQPLTGLTGDEVWLGFEGDGPNALLGASGDGEVVRWPISFELEDEICRAVGRPLTREEWDAAVGGALPDGSYQSLCPATGGLNRTAPPTTG